MRGRGREGPLREALHRRAEELQPGGLGVPGGPDVRSARGHGVGEGRRADARRSSSTTRASTRPRFRSSGASSRSTAPTRTRARTCLRSYYNQGIAQLQNGLYPKAVESFDEVLAIDPGRRGRHAPQEVRAALPQGRPRPDGPDLRPPRPAAAVEPRIVRGDHRSSLDDFPLHEGEPAPLDSSALAEIRRAEPAPRNAGCVAPAGGPLERRRRRRRRGPADRGPRDPRRAGADRAESPTCRESAGRSGSCCCSGCARRCRPSSCSERRWAWRSRS